MSAITVVLGVFLAAEGLALQVELDRPQLCGISTYVVVAEPTDIETRWAADGSIERLVHLAVARTVKGPATDDLEMVLPGGRIGDLTYGVEDVPKLLANARYLLFLGPDLDGRLIVFGGDRGAVRLRGPGERRGELDAVALDSVKGCRAPSTGDLGHGLRQVEVGEGEHHAIGRPSQ